MLVPPMSMGPRRARCAAFMTCMFLVLGFVTCSAETAAGDDNDLGGTGDDNSISEVSAELVLKDLMLWMRDNHGVAPLLLPENSAWLEQFQPQGSSGEHTVALSFAMREALSREIEKASLLLEGKVGDGGTDVVGDAGDAQSCGAELTQLSHELQEAQQVLSTHKAEAAARQHKLGKQLREKNAAYDKKNREYDEVKALYEQALLSAEQAKERAQVMPRSSPPPPPVMPAPPPAMPPPVEREETGGAEGVESGGASSEAESSEAESADGEEEDDYEETSGESDGETIPDDATPAESEETIPESEEAIPESEEEPVPESEETSPPTEPTDDLETAEALKLLENTGDDPDEFPPLETDPASGGGKTAKEALKRAGRIASKVLAKTYLIIEWFIIKFMSSSIGVRLNVVLDNAAMSTQTFATTVDSYIGTSLGNGDTQRFRTYVNIGFVIGVLTVLLTVQWIALSWYRWTFKQRVPTPPGKPKPPTAGVPNQPNGQRKNVDSGGPVVNTAFPAPTMLRHRGQEHSFSNQSVPTQQVPTQQVPTQQVPTQWHPTPMGNPASIPAENHQPVFQPAHAHHFSAYGDPQQHAGFHQVLQQQTPMIPAQQAPAMRRGPPPRVNPVYKHE